MKVKQMIAAVLVVFALSSMGAFAANNKYEFYAFSSNAQKKDSNTSLKEADNDWYAYVTTLSEHDGTKSNVFGNNGAFLARSRRSTKPDTIKTALFSFTTNEAQKKKYTTENMGNQRGAKAD